MKYRFFIATSTVLLVNTLSYGQSKTYDSVRQVDFLNFTFSLPWCAKEYRLPTKVTVKKGSFESKKNDTYVSVNKKEILYTDFTGDNIDEAVVPVVCGQVAANYAGSEEVLVFTLRNGKPELLATLNEGIFEHDYKRYYQSAYLSAESKVRVDHNKLIISKESDGSHASPENEVRLEYIWNGHGFVLAGKPVKKRL